MPFIGARGHHLGRSAPASHLRDVGQRLGPALGPRSTASIIGTDPVPLQRHLPWPSVAYGDRGVHVTG